RADGVRRDAEAFEFPQVPLTLLAADPDPLRVRGRYGRGGRVLLAAHGDRGCRREEGTTVHREPSTDEPGGRPLRRRTGRQRAAALVEQYPELRGDLASAAKQFREEEPLLRPGEQTVVEDHLSQPRRFAPRDDAVLED